MTHLKVDASFSENRFPAGGTITMPRFASGSGENPNLVPCIPAAWFAEFDAFSCELFPFRPIIPGTLFPTRKYFP
jgi:hypothetical protein